MILIKTGMTRKYNIYDCAKWSMTIKDTIIKRAKMGLKTNGFDKCFMCNKKFDGADIPYLALIHNYKNQFICDDCAQKVLMMKGKSKEEEE